LNRLGRRDGAALVERLAGNVGLSREIVGEIVERADGVPLFVEELTKAVLESGDRNAILAASPSPALSIPATLHASLIARLDRLGPIAKEIGQIGAVLGREFGYDLIEPVAQRPDAELRLGLDRLAEAGLLFCRGVAPQSSYLFKHALVQDAAYSTLLRARRQELHARVAVALERHFTDLVERQPEVLAHHLTAAGDNKRAVDQWLKAGKHAAARSGHLEAISHFGRGLAVLTSLPEALTRERHEIEFQLAIGMSSLAAKGFGSSEAALAYARARELCEKRSDPQHLFAALWGLWLSNQSRSASEAARSISDKLLELTRTEDDWGRRLQAHHTAWTTRFFHGEPASCRDHCQKGLRLYNPVMHRSHAALYGGHDPGVCAGNTLGFVQWLLGYPDMAVESSANASALAERLAHPFSWSTAHLWAAALHQFRREPEASLRRVIAAEVLLTEHRLAAVFNLRVLRGGALLAQGGITEAVACLRDGLVEQMTAGQNQLMRQYGFALLAEALSHAGDFDGALSAAAEGLAVAERSGERWWEAELHRLKGVLVFSSGASAESEACFVRSIRIAQRQEAKSLELRSATSLARLWRAQEKREQAHELLAPVYGWFTEGFDTADLRDAKAVLDELT
jgi:predicted ATPase